MHVDLAENQVHADVPDCSKNGFTKQTKTPTFHINVFPNNGSCLEFTRMLLQARTAVNPLFTTTNLTKLPFKSMIYSSKTHELNVHLNLADNVGVLLVMFPQPLKHLRAH
mmetsp:Transcript_76621/g.132556  ORF Transcript_76621/g.132556 Transcript_76621/m.132556 type:complete len:110 (-) Transcript_76621:234-563(-)